jgi:class 3 adenylate cyclase/pimeloyl-ACP methyl ester carboxylesterase
MEREVHYCTSADGTRIAYCVEGQGPPLLISPILFESFSLDDWVPDYKAFIEYLSRTFRVVRYDLRGTGLSEREVRAHGRLAYLSDVDAVVKATGTPKISLMAVAGGGPSIVAYAAENPRVVERLILVWSFVRAHDVAPPHILRGLVDLMRTDWRLGARAFGDLGTRNVVQYAAKLEEWYMRSTTAETAVQVTEALAGMDETASLGAVKCPVLILHPANDPFFTMEVARGMSTRATDSRLVPMADGIHPLTDNWKPIANSIEEFAIGYHRSEAPSPSALRTVLFTDLVGHTEMMSRLGDERGREVLREHERITREVLKAHGGTEVKTMGDGFMASFGSVTKAVECAIALQRAFAEREGEPLSVRVGLNAGEPIEEDGDLFGATVILASRIAAKAEGGEILVADTVRGLCSGKGFLFADRGEFVAKGFEEPVRVYEVRWRE